MNMAYFSLVFSLLWLQLCHSAVISSTLDHQHVIVAAVEVTNGMQVTRNSTGHIIKFDGVDYKIIQWLTAAHINTTFDIIPFNPLTNPLDKSGDKPGVLDLVGKGEYDMMTNSVPTPSRAAIVEYSHPIAFIDVSYIIPSSYQSNNFFSATKPFQNWVWFSVLMAIFVVFATLILMEVIGKNYITGIEVEMIFYVLGILLYQAAAYRFSKRLAIRFVIATWSIGALLLINYYNSLYISFLAISIKKPLIQSIQELPTRPDIKLTMDKNRNIEALLLSAESGLLKGLGDKVRADPGSLCNVTSQCVDLVKQGKAIYTNGKALFLMKAMKEDFESTGKCNLEMGKENYIQIQFSWAMQKQSPYRDPINKSFMRLFESGIPDKLFRQGLPKVEECISTTKMKRDQTAEGHDPLPLKGFTGAFIILMVGTLISLTVFFIEICVARVRRTIMFENNSDEVIAI